MSGWPVAQLKTDLGKHVVTQLPGRAMGLWRHGLDSPGRKEVLPFAEYGEDTG